MSVIKPCDVVFMPFQDGCAPRLEGRCEQDILHRPRRQAQGQPPHLSVAGKPAQLGGGAPGRRASSSPSLPSRSSTSGMGRPTPLGSLLARTLVVTVGLVSVRP